MFLRHLILSVVLSTSAFAQNGALNPPGFSPSRKLLTNTAFAQKASRDSSGFDNTYKLSFAKPVQDKNFYLLSLFQRDREVQKLLSKNQPLQQLAHDKLEALKRAATCNDLACFEELMRFDDSSIEAVSNVLTALASEPEFKRLAKKDLRRSGVFIKYSEQSDAQMLTAAWRDAANGMNRILSIYGVGRDPHYKEIDKVSFDVSKEEYGNLLRAQISKIKLAEDPLFFEPTLNFALRLLEINRRDEAGRYEPLEQGENKEALQNFRKIKWRAYPYSFILVLGSGPGDSSRLSRIGAKRADMAAQLFLQHKAPLLILSGGHVHPNQTPYCEAIEMKRYVMEKYKIPETSILIEPHARHTTTNFRNGARLALRYRIPMDMKSLVTSSEDHIAYTTSAEFRTRCLNEFGYFPVEFIKRISAVEAEFKPALACLFFDANDPLDP